ncbi:MAG: 2-C-methyl-D-erythritol 4-phosphate cytidylyltransferase [Parachlamydiales bacterium]|nr:2-C-methyl-D-erythritol 4-phosphate cytidylyltransferase [Parachlamydiales bacterium]
MKKYFTSLLFLCGGKGSRLESTIPKQYIEINKKPIFQYSFEIFEKIDLIDEIIVVLDESYKNYFTSKKPLKFANSGIRRQDSVFNGLGKVNEKSQFVCIHDSARPFIDKESIEKVIFEAFKSKAAALGHMAINTIKQVDTKKNVLKTLDRSSLMEIQTPQVIEINLLKKAYSYINENNLDVTDDISIIELFNHPTKIVEGKKENIKITTPFDLKYAEKILS